MPKFDVILLLEIGFNNVLTRFLFIFRTVKKKRKSLVRVSRLGMVR